MIKYYGITYRNNYLLHALERTGAGGSSPGVYKNHKYLARVPMSNGKYRYFYSSEEIMAYKRANGPTANKEPSEQSSQSTGENKSLKEKWEERRALLGNTSKSKKGSGGSGSGGGKSRGSGSKGGSSKSDATVKNVQKKVSLSSGAMTFRGYGSSPSTKQPQNSAKNAQSIRQRQKMVAAQNQRRQDQMRYQDQIWNILRRARKRR